VYRARCLFESPSYSCPLAPSANHYYCANHKDASQNVLDTEIGIILSSFLLILLFTMFIIIFFKDDDFYGIVDDKREKGETFYKFKFVGIKLVN
jgi:hypothetical protein